MIPIPDHNIRNISYYYPELGESDLTLEGYDFRLACDLLMNDSHLCYHTVNDDVSTITIVTITIVTIRP